MLAKEVRNFTILQQRFATSSVSSLVQNSERSYVTRCSLHEYVYINGVMWKYCSMHPVQPPTRTAPGCMLSRTADSAEWPRVSVSAVKESGQCKWRPSCPSTQGHYIVSL